RDIELARLGHQQLDEVVARTLPTLELRKVRRGKRTVVLHGDDADGIHGGRLTSTSAGWFAHARFASHPLTAPCVMPATSRLWISMKSTVTGSAPITPPAVKSPHAISYSPISV